ncbi:MAG: hypothetical protein FJ298_13860 [Planctomycetes bacterium]|nr:hypothetical protein [Planctomycetota bacterium]
MILPLRSTLPALVLAASTLEGCALTDPIESKGEVDLLVRRGEYARAVEVASDEVARRPSDPAARENWRLASVAFLLEQGRTLSFERKDTEALTKFEAACEIGPDVSQAIDWREAQLDKLANQWVLTAIDWHAKDELSRASECYEKALEYRPDDARAKNGLGRVLVQLNHRRGMGEKYYLSGLEALSDYWLDQASHHFSATGKYDTDNARADRRRAQADTLRADERVLQASEFEAAGQYAAARNEYRLATLFDSAHPAGLEGLARMRLETQAAELLAESDRRIARRQFDLAIKALEQGEALTVCQREAFVAERERLHVARLQVDYEAARAMEVDHRFEAAISAYGAILEVAPQGFFLDAIARRDTLSDLVAKALAAYERAQLEPDPTAKRRLLEQVLLVYPEFRDAQSQLDSLRALPSGDEPTADEPTADEPRDPRGS